MYTFLTRYLSFQRAVVTTGSPWLSLAASAAISPTSHASTPSNRTMCLANDKTTLPSSMTGPPVAALVPPGQCQFGTEWTSVPLLERFAVSDTSSVLRFALPDRTLPLQLSTCACILANANIDGDDVTRPYTPISTNADVGTFDLLVKHYGPTAKMSRHMLDVIVPVEGDAVLDDSNSIRFKHIEFNVKIQAPFDYQHIYMLVGGTGITPMIQALHAILGDSTAATKVTMLYGSKVSDDILGRDLLHQWATDYADRLTLVDILSDEPADSDWKGERGFITRERMEQHMLPATSAERLMIFMCGPPPMYNALCGPREEKEVTGVLGAMGYSAEQVFKF